MSNGGSSEQKTEKPTPKKLKELRKKGQTARSVELPQAAGLIVIAALLPAALASLASTMMQELRTALAAADHLSEVAGMQLFMLSSERAVRSVLPVVLLAMLTVVVTNMAVSRSKPNPWALKPKFDTFKPVNGIKRVFSTQSLFEGAKILVKLAALGLILFGVVKSGLAQLMVGASSVGALTSAIRAISADVMWRVVALAVLVGAADAAWSLHKFNKQARMGKSEVKQEMKGQEGDPLIKAAIRSRQQRMSRQRMISSVADATVVITNPTHIAVAIKYADGDDTPVVVAKGAGVIAQKIKERAAAAGVSVVENKPVARSLYAACRAGQPIPVELYEAVAQVLAKVYAARRRGGVR